MQEKLEKYATLLREWNDKMNLVAPGTLNDIENRHFADSAQLKEYLPNDVSIIDMGSGAGFPGVILAMNGFDVTCIESIGKKASFLNIVKSELGLDNLKIYNGRLEDFIKLNKQKLKNGNFVFTARAFAPLIKILDFLNPIGKSRLFLLKGRTAKDEIDEARTKYDFEYKSYPSKTGDGFILAINF